MSRQLSVFDVTRRNLPNLVDWDQLFEENDRSFNFERNVVDGELVIVIELPGYEEDRVFVIAEDEPNQRLVVEAKDAKGIARRENFIVSGDFDASRTTASLRLGMLTLKVPATERRRSKTIRINET